MSKSLGRIKIDAEMPDIEEMEGCLKKWDIKIYHSKFLEACIH